MKQIGMTTAAFVLILACGVAVAQQETRTAGETAREQPARECLNDLERAKQQHDGSQLSDTARNEVRQLSESARILGQRGDEEGCQSIVQTINSIAEDDQTRMREQENLQTLQNAPSVTEYQGVLEASSINGAAVRNLQNEEVGSIEETVIDPGSGEISYVAVSVGGFLGVGERLVAVPWGELHIVEGEEGADRYFVINADKRYLEQRPQLDQDDWPEEISEEWQPQETGSSRSQERRQ